MSVNRRDHIVGTPAATAGLSSSVPRMDNMDRKHCQTSWQWRNRSAHCVQGTARPDERERTYWEKSHMCRFMLHVCLPTFIGASVYLLFRTSTLLVFKWGEAVGLHGHLMALRERVSEVQLPEWLLYSFPDGVWVYATTMCMLIIWNGAPPWPWLSIGLVLAVGAELGQAVGYVQGTYEHLDILFYFGAFLLALLKVRCFYETSPTLCDSRLGHGFSCFR